MSLLTDPSYLIYQMRLALINNDQTAKKIVTLPIYSEDDYLVYSNSPEDNTYSSSPNITMMGSDLYQTKKGKSPFSPYLGSNSVRSQQIPQSAQPPKTLKTQKSSQTSSNNLQLPQQRIESDSTSCRSTNSLQLEDDDGEEAEYNESMSSSNNSKEKEPVKQLTLSENLFIKQKHILTLDGGRSVPTWKPLVSNLSQLLKQNNSSSNPFADYRFFCGKGDPDSMELMIYLPFSDEPEKPLQIMVKKTATVEDVIGYSLYEYNEAERKPVITSEMDVPYWNMRIVEDDGEIDEDFPALERSRKIQKFAFDSFAICKASQAEISKNLSVRTTKQTKTVTNVVKPAADVTITTDSSSKTYFIRVNLYSTLEVKQTTTQQFPSNMLLRDVFKSICQKRKYDIKDYVLKMADTKTDVPLDKTLEQAKLQEICVLKRDRGGAGDIFLRPPDEKDQSTLDSLSLNQDDYSSIYKQWTVSYRHFMGKSECILIIDGEYIYITSNENKFLKKTSYHIGSVEMCRTHHKNNSIIKFMIKRAHDTKSYEFEAASSQEAEEICMKIKILNERIKREHNS
ncbi:SIN1-domain-containing protein [Anaeromyces robustus]|uniref:SIN1-domain-containing protein n=1 Tax=Anaeromyces robustus TaxID=1754192 RepID=A0A1Y1XQC0_9FUNG|nr:SIN1-domain-containing protein [Anaeromyces robustus]|eukprot:ORX87931.1 SIN1-domain-containing protein [Anaeromyces robustus]